MAFSSDEQPSANGDSLASRIASVVRQTTRKARGRSVAELRERGTQLLAAALEQRGLSSAVRETSDSDFWQRVSPAIASSANKDPAALHELFRGRASRNFFAGPGELAETAAAIRAMGAPYTGRVIEAADAVRTGRFRLLGYADLDFGSPIDWHLDPTSGIRAPRIHWSRIPYLDPRVVGDHKVVWELNRHQHFMLLGRAYAITGAEQYAQTFVDHVSSWMDDNPPKQGVNWASSLEVSYRLISWLWALELFRDSPLLTPAVRLRMLKYLYVHATHLERFLSTYFSPNTHLTGEALGLLYAGTALAEFRRAPRWAQLGWQILERQLERQIYPDGVYFEQATHYHRYTADIYLHATLLARAGGRPVPARMLERLDAAIDHLADLTRPDGSVPAIGDDDGGSLTLLEVRRCNDVRAVLATAGALFNRSKYAYVANSISEETLWLLGANAARTLESLRGVAPTDGSRAFETGGYVVMRDGWGATADHAVIDCGPHGTANCGHSHADALSIDLVANGCALLVDPGTFSYSNLADRDHFRRTAAHNTVTVDDASSSVAAGPFAWERRTDARLDTWFTHDTLDYFSGRHNGYERLAPGIIHQRRVLFVKKSYWVIWDMVHTDQPRAIDAHFHTAAGTEVSASLHGRAWLERRSGERAVRALVATFGTADRLDVASDWVSECYGSRRMAPVLRLSAHAAGRHDFITTIIPATASAIVDVREIAAEGGYAIQIQQDEIEDVVLLRTGSRVSTDALTSDADVTWARRNLLRADSESLAMLSGRIVTWNQLGFERSGVGHGIAHRAMEGWRCESAEDPIVVTSERPPAPLTSLR